MKTLSLLIALCLLPLGGWAHDCPCPDIDCSLNNPSGKMCKLDENGCSVYVEPGKSNEWHEKCESFLKEAEAFYNELGTATYKQIEVNANMATAYCTRALLEEMDNDK